MGYRQPMRRRRVTVALVALAGLALPTAAARADGTVTADYSGTLTGTFVYDPARPALDSEKRTLKWQETATYGVTATGPNDVTARLVSSSLTASGEIDAVYAPPNQASSCSGTIGLAQGFNAQNFGWPSVAASFDGTKFEADALAPLTAPEVASTGSGDCGIPSGGISVLGPVKPDPQSQGDDWLSPQLIALSNAPTTSKPYKVDYTAPDNRSHLVVDATLTLTNVGGAAPSPPGPANGPFLPADKAVALQDLRTAVAAAAGPCLQEGTGLLMFGAGAVLLGAGPAIGPVLVITGSLTAALLAPLCTEAIKRVVSDYRRYHDPPFPDFQTAAEPVAIDRRVPLPSCGHAGRAVRAFCASLRARYAALLLAARRVSADDHALELTVGRQTAAHTAGDTAAVALQARTATTLEQRMVRDLHAQGSAGAAVRSLLRGRHVRLQLTRGQSTKAIGAVVRLAGRQGVTRAQLAAVAPTALRPRSVDVLAGFADPG